jgi:hypothetical protein
MNKYYKVFISSTYADLQEERQYVMQALMEVNCIPVGMELFPAADEEQWEFIKKIIDDCDYYILIIGGKYGSTSSDGISYTEKEFNYAVVKGLKVICLLHKNLNAIPLGKSEQKPEKKEKLTSFYEKAKNGRLVKFWEKLEELRSETIVALIHAINNYPAIGYVRANLVPDESSISEILKLRNQIIDLENQLESISTTAPSGTELYVQGDDLFEIHYSFLVSEKKSLIDLSFESFAEKKSCSAVHKCSWNNIFSAIAPLMVNEAIEDTLVEQLNSLVLKANYDYLLEQKMFSSKILSAFRIDNSDFQIIKTQLKVLGLITISSKTRSIKDTGTYWTLTPYGDTIMTRLIAIKRKV